LATQVVFVIAVAYASLVIGTILKFVINGVRGLAISVAFFMPIFFLVAPIMAISIAFSPRVYKEPFNAAFDLAKQSRIKFAYWMLLFTVQSFPFFITITSEILLVILASTKKFRLEDVIVGFFANRFQQTWLAERMAH